MNLVKNKTELVTTELRKQALELIEAGITAVLPQNIMKSRLNYDLTSKILTINNDSYNLSSGRLFIIGGGKAAGAMAKTLESIIPPDDICAGVVICNTGDHRPRKIEILEAGHPIPDQRGQNGVRKILEIKDEYSITEHDLILCLLSGGGSALMTYPVEGVSLNDQQKTTELLLASGAEIQEINIVRKHISKIKGGKLGSYFSPATVVSLIISDVVGNDLSAIASGPTVNDPSNCGEAYNVLKKYDLVSKAPVSVTSFLTNKICQEAQEKPMVLDNCKNYIIGDNQLALNAMSTKARELGLNPVIITAKQKGNPAEIARKIANEICTGKYSEYDVILIGGETTFQLPERHGRGGRNQHYAAVSTLAMKEYPGNWLVASVGSDGSDFIHNIAGAIVDNNTLNKFEVKGLNVSSFIDKCDTF